MLKKIIAGVAMAAVAAVSVVPASARTYTHVENYSVKTNGSLTFFTYNVDSTSRAFITLENETKDTSETVRFGPLSSHPTGMMADKNDTYKPMIGVSLGSGSSSGGGARFTFSDTAGSYEKIRIKLSDYSSYFEKNGHRIETVHGKKHSYTFCEEPQLDNGDQYTSVLVFMSGGCFTCAVPDKKGEVEIYVKRQIGVPTYYSTGFSYKVDNSVGSGGGVNHSRLLGVTLGDADGDGYITISDATQIQKGIADQIKLSGIEKRNSDTNLDGTVNILDVTKLQRYLADMY